MGLRQARIIGLPGLKTGKGRELHGSFLCSSPPADTVWPEADMATTDRLSIIMFSGTADKFIPLGVLAQAAAAMGSEVRVFVTGFALLGFTKQHHDLPFPTEFATMAPALAQGMARQRVAPWNEMLAQARALGAKVYACSMMSGVMGLQKADFNETIDDVVGAATFLNDAAGGETLFI
jgi:peroxiredoxin family protein